MGWNFKSGEAVYQQIAHRLRYEILGGKYAPLEQMPAVRALALESAANPNTVQRAFALLEEEGILETRGTAGRFVTGERAVLEEARRREATALTEEFLEKITGLGLNRDEVRNLLEKEGNL